MHNPGAMGRSVETTFQAILDTTKLLERILVQLDMQQIFVCQRVCRAFRNAIAKSTPLQAKMFLTPDEERPEAAIDNAVRNGQAVWCFEGHKGSQDGIWRILCPFVDVKDIRPVSLPKETRQTVLYGLGHPITTNVGDSWKRMLLCDPPVRDIFADIVYYGPETIYEYIGRISNPEGVTFGDLVPTKSSFWTKGQAAAFGAYSGTVKSLGEIVKIPEEIVESLQLVDGPRVVVDLQRSRFAFYPADTVDLKLQFYSV